MLFVELGHVHLLHAEPTKDGEEPVGERVGGETCPKSRSLTAFCNCWKICNGRTPKNIKTAMGRGRGVGETNKITPEVGAQALSWSVGRYVAAKATINWVLSTVCEQRSKRTTVPVRDRYMKDNVFTEHPSNNTPHPRSILMCINTIPVL